KNAGCRLSPGPDRAPARSARSSRSISATTTRTSSRSRIIEARRSAVPLAPSRRSWHSGAVPQTGEAAMKIDRIDHLNITVADIDRSIEFYQRVLGMRSERMGEGRAALLFGEQKIHLDL